VLPKQSYAISTVLTNIQRLRPSKHDKVKYLKVSFQVHEAMGMNMTAGSLRRELW
jgi:hydroxymethylglutaryl-CoA reductase